MAEQQKVADAAALQKQRQKAMDFVIHQLLPDKMLHMARICKGAARVSGERGEGEDEGLGAEGHGRVELTSVIVHTSTR